jgi:hypothetical protein
MAIMKFRMGLTFLYSLRSRPLYKEVRTDRLMCGSCLHEQLLSNPTAVRELLIFLDAGIEVPDYYTVQT